MSSQKAQNTADSANFDWDDLRGTFYTTKGGWVVGEAVYNHGYSMMDELVGKASFFQVLVLNITGRLPPRPLGDWLEAVFICLSWPDPRIWCNQIASLGGTARTSPVAAACAGTLAADSRMYGAGTLEAAAQFIIDAHKAHNQGTSVIDIIEHNGRVNPKTGVPLIVGFVRPIATGDERVTAMERVADDLGFATGPHLETAYAIERSMYEKYGEGMNLAGYCAAFMVDQGYTPSEIYRIHSLWVNSGVHACYAEAFDRPAGAFLPMQCGDMDYVGPAPRPVPAASTT